jgi:hypothetical protein
MQPKKMLFFVVRYSQRWTTTLDGDSKLKIETELHVGPDSDSPFIHIKSSDVCNFAGILIFSLLFFFFLLFFLFESRWSSPTKKNWNEKREKHSNIWLTIAWRSNVSNRSTDQVHNLPHGIKRKKDSFHESWIIIKMRFLRITLLSSHSIPFYCIFFHCFVPTAKISRATFCIWVKLNSIDYRHVFKIALLFFNSSALFHNFFLWKTEVFLMKKPRLIFWHDMKWMNWSFTFMDME